MRIYEIIYLILMALQTVIMFFGIASYQRVNKEKWKAFQRVAPNLSKELEK